MQALYSENFSGLAPSHRETGGNIVSVDGRGVAHTSISIMSPISRGAESRQGDFLIQEGGMKLVEGERIQQSGQTQRIQKQPRPDVSIWSRDTLGSKNGRKTVN